MPTNPSDLPSPQLALRVDERDRAKVVVCEGWLTAEFASKFKSDVKGLIAGSRKIVLDLADLTYMDSSGLGAIAGLYVSARTAGCEFRVANMSRHVRELFKITHLLSVLGEISPATTKLP